MSPRRRGRGLTPEDRAIWNDVVRSVTPRAGLDRARPETAVTQPGEDDASPLSVKITPPPAPRQRPVPPTGAVPVADVTGKTADSASQLDKKTADRLRRGQLRPDRKLDLHGMTAARAHAVLNGFIREAHAEGARLVLVVTGKGSVGGQDETGAPRPRGVLRASLPTWLSAPGLAPLIVRIAPAHQRHGGGGAFYVYLRRSR